MKVATCSFRKEDGASLNTLQFAQKKARHAAAYGAPSREGAEAVKNGHVEDMAFPNFFPNQGGLPVRVDGQLLGGIAASGAKSEIDEQIAQAGIDALLKKYWYVLCVSLRSSHPSRTPKHAVYHKHEK